MTKITPPKIKIIIEELRTLVEGGYLEALAPWATSLVMAKKKSNQFRVCCVFQFLNAQAVKVDFQILPADRS